MVGNDIQFAVVREDPEIEIKILRQNPKAKQTLLIASGGCTALTLSKKFADHHFTLLEPNPAQIELVKRKLKALVNRDAERTQWFGIGSETEDSLTSCGNFESLFRCLRNYVWEFVLEKENWFKFFENRGSSQALLSHAFSSKYWPVAFQIFFSDPYLRAMFGDEAIQHAPPGSYPKYFQGVIEAGLKSPKAQKNYFLHHIFLGHYIDDVDSLPTYLTENFDSHATLEFVQSTAHEVLTYRDYDLISLSNIFDWMNEDAVATLAKKLASEMKPGASLVFRQLNHAKNFQKYFGNSIQFDDALSAELLSEDRSLFYSRINVGRKQNKEN